MDNPILMVVLGILCTCEIIHTVIAILMFHRPEPHIPPQTTSAPQLSPMEEEKMRMERKRFDDEMEAFQQILNYNADVAYGTKSIKE